VFGRTEEDGRTGESHKEIESLNKEEGNRARGDGLFIGFFVKLMILMNE
jgi:hypothetical protein